MAQVNLTTAYATINYVKVRNINIDPINQKIYASVYYFYSKDNVEYVVAPVQYNNATGGMVIESTTSGTVILEGADYTSYNTYIGQGKTPEQAVLQILLDKAVIAGTLV